MDRPSSWFGIADWEINYTAVSTAAIAFVQIGSIVIGHVVGRSGSP